MPSGRVETSPALESRLFRIFTRKEASFVSIVLNFANSATQDGHPALDLRQARQQFVTVSLF